MILTNPTFNKNRVMHKNENASGHERVEAKKQGFTKEVHERIGSVESLAKTGGMNPAAMAEHLAPIFKMLNKKKISHSVVNCLLIAHGMQTVSYKIKKDGSYRSYYEMTKLSEQNGFCNPYGCDSMKSLRWSESAKDYLIKQIKLYQTAPFTVKECIGMGSDGSYPIDRGMYFKAKSMMNGLFQDCECGLTIDEQFSIGRKVRNVNKKLATPYEGEETDDPMKLASFVVPDGYTFALVPTGKNRMDVIAVPIK